MLKYATSKVTQEQQETRQMGLQRRYDIKNFKPVVLGKSSKVASDPLGWGEVAWRASDRSCRE